jgi:hypothetical protein
MKNLFGRFLGVAFLGTACAFAFTGESSVGRPVDDSLAVSIRGGGACDNDFTYNNENPVWCPGREVGCSQTIPNSQTVGKGGTSGVKTYSCGAAAGCGHYAGPADCARPSTSISTGIVMD